MEKSKKSNFEEKTKNLKIALAFAQKNKIGVERVKRDFENLKKEAEATAQLKSTQPKPLETYPYFSKEELPMIDKCIPKDFASNSRHIMKLPVFSLETKRIKDKVIKYNFTEKGIKYHLKVYTNEEFGIADHRDGDIVRHALSHVIHNYNMYGKLTDSVCFSQYELLKEIGKDTNKQGYEWLKDAMNRLSSTHYVTNLWAQDPLDTFHGTLLSVQLNHDPKFEKRYVEITFNRKALHFLVSGGILSIHKEILKESSNLRKKLLEVIQSYMGKSETWQISVKNLMKACGYKKSQRRFKENIKRIDLPYQIEKKINTQKEQILYFSKTKKAPKNT